MQFSTSDCANLTDKSVTVVAEHRLLPTKAYNGDEVKLGPLESLVAPQIPVAVLYLYEKAADGRGDPVPLDAFKKAVEETLTFYPQLAGRLRLDEATGNRSMHSLNEGALLLEATSSDELGKFRKVSTEHPELPEYRLLDLPAGGNAFFAPFSPEMRDVLTSPALSIQHTKFACGSVVLGIRLLHTLADAAAFVQFVGDVADVYKQLHSGASSVQLPPTGAETPFAVDWADKCTDVAEREAILRKTPPHMYVVGDTAKETAYRELHEANGLPCPAPLPSVTVGKMLHFTGAELAAMKTRYATNSDGVTSNLSVFQVLSAFLYARVYKAKMSVLQVTAAADGEAPPKQAPPATFLTSVNIRALLAANDDTGRMRADRYFGNGVYAPMTEFPVSIAESGSVEDIAACVHNFLKKDFPADDSAVMDMVRWVALQPNKADIRTMFVLGGFMVSAWNNFDLYDSSTFGDSRPVLVATPFTPISLVDVLGYYLPLNPTKGDRGLVVYLAAGKDVWELLEQIPDVAAHVFQ